MSGNGGNHLFFDSILNPCRGFARSPEIIAGNPCRNGSVYGNPAYEAFRVFIRAQSEFPFRCYSDPDSGTDFSVGAPPRVLGPVARQVWRNVAKQAFWLSLA